MAVYRLSIGMCSKMTDELFNSNMFSLNGKVSALWGKLEMYKRNMELLGSGFVELSDTEVEYIQESLDIVRRNKF